MIQRSAVLKTVEGDIITFPLTEQYWEVRFTAGCVDKDTGDSNVDRLLATVHVRRSTLEKAGLLPRVDTPRAEPPSETPEQLMIRLLRDLGVKFEDDEE